MERVRTFFYFQMDTFRQYIIAPLQEAAISIKLNWQPLEELIRGYRVIRPLMNIYPEYVSHPDRLGQGMSVAIGAALTKKLNKEDRVVYSLHGDGELDEGQVWEAIMFAAHHKVDNLISTIDWNGQQIDGPTDKVMGLGNIKQKFEVFGWTTLEMNGNDMDEVVATLEKAKALVGKGKPIAIMMHTIMSKGVDFMENDHNWHGVAPNDEQLAKALAQLPETIGDY